MQDDCVISSVLLYKWITSFSIQEDVGCGEDGSYSYSRPLGRFFHLIFTFSS